MDLPCSGDRAGHQQVLFLFERTGGINQPASWPQMAEGIAEKSNLLAVQIHQVGGFEPPFNLRVAAQRPGSGTWSIYQNPIELSAEGQRLGSVQDYAFTIQIPQIFEAMPVDIAGDGLGAKFQSLRGFVAGSRAKIQKGHAGIEVEMRDHGFSGDVLHAAGARDVGFDRLE